MIQQGVCNKFLDGLLVGAYNCSASGDAFKVALYDSTASLDKDTTAYTTTGELTGTGYTAGGLALTNLGVTTSGDTRIVRFNDADWPSSTFTCEAALVYHVTSGDAIAVIYVGGATVSSQTFRLKLSSTDPLHAVIKLTRQG